MNLKQYEIKAFYDYLMQLEIVKISITEIFSEWLIKEKDLSELEAFEIIDTELSKVIMLIEKDIKFHESKYTYPKYKFSTYDKDILISTHFDFINEKDEVSSKIIWWNKLNELIKKIDWRTFEILAKHILNANGLTQIEITQAQNDQGIDFYGYFTFSSTNKSYRLYKDLKFRIVGQVKHSNTNKGVNHQKIASFGTEIKKLRTTNNSNYFQNLSDDFLLSPFPIIGIFIANSYYPKKSIDFANEYGIIFWDGIQISQDLAIPEFINKIKLNDSELSLEKLIEEIKVNG